MPAGRPSRRSAEIRIAVRRMAAITVFIAALALTSPPAAAPTDRLQPPAPSSVAALDTDPLLGPWDVERFLTPYPTLQDFPAAQHGGTASTPAAVLPAAGVRTMWVVRRTRVAALTLWELVRQGSVAVRIGLRWLRHIDWEWPIGTVHQDPLPTPSGGGENLPVFGPDGFDDILNFRGTGTLRSGMQLPVAGATSMKAILDMTAQTPFRTVTVLPHDSAAAAQTRFARPRDGPFRFAETGGHGSPSSCF